MRTRLLRRGAALGSLAAVLGAGTALAAVHFKPNALYTGQSPACKGGGKPPQGASCEFKFRASSDGTKLRFTGKTVVSTWGCHGGGGEALLGGKLKGHDVVPVIKLGAKRKLHGTAGRGEKRISVTGRLAKSGKSATITFHAPPSCISPKITLTR